MDAQGRTGLAHERSVAPRARANVVYLDRYRNAGVPRDDVPLNAEWDRLARLAEEAWIWRDPESLAELGVCVARLGLRALEDWQP
jgi:hypothetical protein